MGRPPLSPGLRWWNTHATKLVERRPFHLITELTGATENGINWGKFTLRASKTGYVPTELSIEVLPPGWSCDTLPRPPESPSCPPGQMSASSDVRQDFVLQRTGSC
jgi:hypothetical protein